MEISWKDIPWLNEDMSHNKIIESVDSTKGGNWMGLGIYDSFNVLSDSDKRKIMNKITGDCLEFGSHFEESSFNMNESVNDITVIHEGFKNLPLDLREKKVKEYIESTLESSNG